MTQEVSGRICAVVVTYHPDPEKMARLVAALHAQQARICVVDNGSAAESRALVAATLADADVLLPMGANLGIAAAQNAGIARALSDGAEFVALFDHDSLPGEGMLAALEAVARARQADGVKVAAVGPRYLDERQANPPPFLRIERGRLHRLPCPCGNEVHAVDYLIASGSLIPAATLRAVGNMREDLFIDYVDIEWGLRARAQGFQSFGVCAAAMHHDLGDEPKRVFGKAFPVRSPLRHYYMFRNAVLLYRMPHIPKAWKWVDGSRLFLKLGFYGLFARPRLAHLRMMGLGLWHGLAGRYGKL